MEQTAMEDIFTCLNFTNVTWGKVRNFIVRKSGLGKQIQTFLVCPVHTCFAPNNSDIPPICSECNTLRSALTTNKLSGKYSKNYLPIFPRIVAYYKTKNPIISSMMKLLIDSKAITLSTTTSILNVFKEWLIYMDENAW